MRSENTLYDDPYYGGNDRADDGDYYAMLKIFVSINATLRVIMVLLSSLLGLLFAKLIILG